MGLSIFSFLNAVVWFNVGAVLITYLQKQEKISARFSPVVLVVLLLLSIGRVFLPLDAPFFWVINSYHLLRWLQIFLTFEILPGFMIWYLIAAVWIGGTVFVLTREVRFVMIDTRVREGWARFPNDRAVQLAHKLDVRAKDIVICEEVDTPKAIGVFRPTIYLPNVPLTDTELTWILLHERQHIRRKDIFIKLIYLIVEAVFWWNPLIRRAYKKLNDMLELRCDYFVTKTCTPNQREEYFNAILTILRYREHEEAEISRSLVNTIPLASSSQREILIARLQTIYTSGKGLHPKDILLAIVASALILSTYCVLFQPAGKPPANDIDDSTVITADNAYIIQNDDGSFELWIDNVLYHILPDDEVDSFRDMGIPIYDKES